MFGFLKKKINSFTEKIKDKLEKKEETILREEQKPVDEPKEEVLETIKEEKAEELKEHKIEVQEEEKEFEEYLSAEEKEVLAEVKEIEKKIELEEKLEIKKEKKEAVKEFSEKIEKQIEEKAETEVLKEKKEDVFEEQFEERLEETVSKKITSDLIKERELKAKVSLTSNIKKFFTGKIKIEEKDVKDFLEEFELALLESDVEQETSLKIIQEIRTGLIGKEIEGKNITEILKKEIALILEKIMDVPAISLQNRMKDKKPFVILFLGPNGAGKTTSISKIAFKFKEKGKQVVLAAADTFRAASIEQIEKHAERIGVRLVKHQYGSDPAAVAFDAVKAAEAKNMDLVLIDSAGRQDTNVNLMNELKKIDRVVKPDLKLFVGEAMSGNSLYQQAKEFNEKIGFDGFILTKIDTDAKGGTAISLISGLQKPVVFVGTGQNYNDLVEFTPRFLTERIIK